MIRHGLRIAACAILFTSCAIDPPALDPAADYGAAPQEYEARIRAYFSETLKDPESAQYKEITAPERGYVRDSFVDGGRVHYGWLIRATINARNSYGGYVGFRAYSFLFRGDEITKIVPPAEVAARPRLK